MTPEQEELAAAVLRAAADAFESMPPKLKRQYVDTLRLYADQPWRLGSDFERQQ